MVDFALVGTVPGRLSTKIYYQPSSAVCLTDDRGPLAARMPVAGGTSPMHTASPFLDCPIFVTLPFTSSNEGLLPGPYRRCPTSMLWSCVIRPKV